MGWTILSAQELLSRWKKEYRPISELAPQTGDRFYFLDDEYIYCRINYDKHILICLRDGNRWNDAGIGPFENFKSFYKVGDKIHLCTEHPDSPSEPKIIEDCRKIVEKGTGIAVFDYHGKTRNVLIGSNICKSPYNHVEIVPRSVSEYIGHQYLTCIDNNNDHQVKKFRIDRIENWR